MRLTPATYHQSHNRLFHLLIKWLTPASYHQSHNRLFHLLIKWLTPASYHQSHNRLFHLLIKRLTLATYHQSHNRLIHLLIKVAATTMSQYVGIRVYLAKGHLFDRRTVHESWSRSRRLGYTLCIPPEPDAALKSLLVKREFSSLTNKQKHMVADDWYAIVPPLVKDENKMNLDPNVYYVNGRLQKHAKFISCFNSGVEAVQFTLDRFRATEMRERLSMIGNVGNIKWYYDKLDSPWKGIRKKDLEARLTDLFTFRPRLHVFKTQGRFFVREAEFFFDVITGDGVDADTLLANESKWDGVEEEILDDSTLIYF